MITRSKFTPFKQLQGAFKNTVIGDSGVFASNPEKWTVRESPQGD